MRLEVLAVVLLWIAVDSGHLGCVAVLQCPWISVFHLSGDLVFIFKDQLVVETTAVVLGLADL